MHVETAHLHRPMSDMYIIQSQVNVYSQACYTFIMNKTFNTGISNTFGCTVEKVVTWIFLENLRTFSMNSEIPIYTFEGKLQKPLLSNFTNFHSKYTSDAFSNSPDKMVQQQHLHEWFLMWLSLQREPQCVCFKAPVRQLGNFRYNWCCFLCQVLVFSLQCYDNNPPERKMFKVR